VGGRRAGQISVTGKVPPAPWRNRIVGVGEEAPDQLLANPQNWRTHPAPQRDALRGSLSDVGWVQQVMVNRRTGFVVDGHARLEEALSRHELTVPVLYVDLDPDEEALVLATLDPIGAMATTNGARLAELLAEISPPDAALAALLADMAARAGIAPKAGLADPDDVPELSDEPYVRTGELWILGEHRLLCGDATNAQDEGQPGFEQSLLGRVFGLDGVAQQEACQPVGARQLRLRQRDEGRGDVRRRQPRRHPHETLQFDGSRPPRSDDRDVHPDTVPAQKVRRSGRREHIRQRQPHGLSRWLAPASDRYQAAPC
jgi:hypothetical protein